MSFAAPFNLLWLIPALAAVTLLYMLRRPRRDIIVPTTIFWRAIPGNPVQTRRLQKLTPQLLYFLQLLAATLLVLAAAQPQLLRAAPQRQCWAVILDNGVTMQAIDGTEGRSRFAEAQLLASHIVQQASAAGAEVTVVTSAPPSILAASSDNAASALQAIQQAQPSDAASDLPGAALVTAAALHLQTHGRNALCRAVIVSDGSWNSQTDAACVLKPVAFAAPALCPVVAPSSATPDIGITRLAVQRDPLQPQTRLQIFAQIAATGGYQGAAQFSLLEGNHPIFSQTITATQTQPRQITLTLPAPQRQSALKATLTPSGRDDLSADNVAFAVLPQAGAARVLLIGGSDGVALGLERILGLIPGIQVDETRLASLSSTGVPAGYALYIFDPEGEANDATPPNLPGNTLVFSPQNRSFTSAQQTPANDSGVVVDWDRSHPILRFADLTGTTLHSLAAWSNIEDWQPLIESGQGYIAAVKGTETGSGSARAVQFSFSPRESGFDRLPAFPIILNNAVDWLAMSDGNIEPAGTQISLAPVNGGWAVTRQTLAGKSQLLAQQLCNQHNTPCAENDTFVSGIYVAQSEQGTELFARSSQAAASLSPQEHPLLPLYGAATRLSASSSNRVRVQSSLLSLAAAVCLLTLILEWLTSYAPHTPRRRSI